MDKPKAPRNPALPVFVPETNVEKAPTTTFGPCLVHGNRPSYEQACMACRYERLGLRP